MSKDRYHDAECPADRRFPRWMDKNCICKGEQHLNTAVSAPVDVKALEALTGGAQDMTGLAIITIEERDAVCAALRIAVEALRDCEQWAHVVPLGGNASMTPAASRSSGLRHADGCTGCAAQRALAAIEKEVKI